MIQQFAGPHPNLYSALMGILEMACTLDDEVSAAQQTARPAAKRVRSPTTEASTPGPKRPRVRSAPVAQAFIVPGSEDEDGEDEVAPVVKTRPKPKPKPKPTGRVKPETVTAPVAPEPAADSPSVRTRNKKTSSSALAVVRVLLDCLPVDDFDLL